MPAELPRLTSGATTLSHAKTSARFARRIRDEEILSKMIYVVRQINAAVNEGLRFVTVPAEEMNPYQAGLLRRMGYSIDISSSRDQYTISWAE